MGGAAPCSTRRARSFGKGACCSGRNPVSLIPRLITASSPPSRLARHVVRRSPGESAGPHLEDLAREWCLSHASSGTLGGSAHDVLPATVACREHRQGHEIDVVVVETSAGAPRRVVAIGEVTSTVRPVDLAEITRLDHLRDLLPDSRVTTPPRLLVLPRRVYPGHSARGGEQAGRRAGRSRTPLSQRLTLPTA